MRTLKSEGFKGAKALAEVRTRAGDVGASVRLITGALNLGTLGIGVATGILTLERGPPAIVVMLAAAIVIVFADVLPRSIAVRHPVRLSSLRVRTTQSDSMDTMDIGAGFQVRGCAC